ncbi:MAG: bis(5'-nucleosyl)-tetraphosphatase (symmetrical) YqeK [Clostridia bacterium]|nr:bis(5'-nucleosyl)-tetraphosphatase (symmetrical) YqeK [Clostridia bacterium]
MDLKEIQKYVKENLSEKRYNHSVGVMERAKELAIKFGADVDICAKIGIAHDIAKEIPEEEKINYCIENNIEIDETEKINTTLLHAKIGKDIAIKKFGFTESMGQAIANHTTGNKNMDLYSKILFIADRTSKDRNFEDLEYLKSLEDKGIDEAVLYILDKKIELQIKKKAQIHLNGIIARNSLLENMKK